MMLNAMAINCSLKSGRSGEHSSTDSMIKLFAGELQKHGVSPAGTIRLADCNIIPGVSSDEGKGDDWPVVRRCILEAHILIFGTPIWLGQMSSIAKRVLERMDAFLGETDAPGPDAKHFQGRGCGHCWQCGWPTQDDSLFVQSVQRYGRALPAGAACYWVG